MKQNTTLVPIPSASDPNNPANKNRLLNVEDPNRWDNERNKNDAELAKQTHSRDTGDYAGQDKGHTEEELVKPQEGSTENGKSDKNKKSGKTTAGGDTLVATLGQAVVGAALGKVFDKWLGTGKKKKTVGNNAQINAMPLCGTLGSVENTKEYMQTTARYNNYLTCNLGLAQMASDRYMSLKERIPMCIEYYATPEERKSITMYVNPENMSISTAKVKQKVFTRGGIYFHHYGDDVWTLKINGTTGYSQMKGIEALEEVYFHSGTLLKYQNVSVTTVHTNQMTLYKPTDMQDALDKLKSAGGVSGWLGKVIGTATDALGYTGDGSKSLGTKIFGAKTASGKSNANLFDALNNSCIGLSNHMIDVINGGSGNGSGNGSVLNLMQAASLVTGNPTAIKEYFNQTVGSLKQGFGGFTSQALLGAFAADSCATISGKQGHNMENMFKQMNGATKNAFGSVLNMLTGNFTGAATYALPMTGTSGNFYTLGRMTANELNNVVGSVQSFNKEHMIDKDKARANWADMEDQLTDLYRPRQIIIYFDDRVYIGHFDSFNYNRKAATPLIYYDMTFTVTRQIKIDKQPQDSAGSASLGSLLGMAVAGSIVRGISNSIKKGKSGGLDPRGNENTNDPRV